MRLVDLDALPLVFTRADALDLGLRRARFDRLCRGSELVVVAPGHHADAVRWAVATPGERLLALGVAACGAFDPTSTVHARASLGPTVKKVIRWRRS